MRTLAPVKPAFRDYDFCFHVMGVTVWRTRTGQTRQWARSSRFCHDAFFMSHQSRACRLVPNNKGCAAVPGAHLFLTQHSSHDSYIMNLSRGDFPEANPIAHSLRSIVFM
jgi:hypothetical protein